MTGFCLAAADVATTTPTTTGTQVTDNAMTTVPPSLVTTVPVDTTKAIKATTGNSMLPTNATLTSTAITSAAPDITSPIATTMPTTAPATTPPPSRDNNWNVTGKNGLMCQSMQFCANVTVPYYNTSNLPDSVTVSVPSSSNANGTCSMKEREFILDFIPDGGNETWTLKFVFTANTSSYQLTSLNVKFSYEDVFFNTKKRGQQSSTYISMDGPLAGLTAPLGCPCERDTVLIQSTDKQQLHAVFSDLNIQPFYDKEHPKICQPPKTPSDSPSNVWRSVGVAFIIMFVVLLLASALYCFYVKKKKTTYTGDQIDLVDPDQY
ncbi:uncharacterized protein LOC119723836 [Patiria miniata]|uniref:Lysosome-associated membrane glycoprotein 5 n=1 Tax=Patiria miniata TaxID=46514 RepID=A0A913ZGU8_PATMI|nr:uncharacterized protein LOC119723836 [Patiria miniata]